MASRRSIIRLGTTGLVTGATSLTRAEKGKYANTESRLLRGDFANLYKEDLPTPAMIVDLDLFERNLRHMAEHCRESGIALRGHVKVHKSPEIAKRQIALGGIGVTCATVAECELMADARIKGVLLTRQPAGRNNIERTVVLAKREPTFATVIDDSQVADWLNERAAREGVKLKVAVDVFVGLKRHGIQAGAPALELAKQVDKAKHLQLIGLMGYSGGAAHVPGWEARKIKSREDLSGLRESVALARKAGLPVEIVTGGSTGTYNIDSESKDLTELQAGSFVFMDTLYKVIGGKNDAKAYSDFNMALTVLTTVISARHSGMCTIDAGNKAMLRQTDEVKGYPEVKVINQGAEYGGLTWRDDDAPFKLGERVEIYPSNLDMSTAVYDRYYLARGEKIVGVWPIMGRQGAAQR